MKQSQTFSHYYQRKHRNLFKKAKILTLSTFLSIFQASFPVKYNRKKKTKTKKTGLHMKLIYFSYIQGIYVPSLLRAMTQQQKYFILNNIEEATLQQADHKT